MLKSMLVASDTETTGLRFWQGDRPFMWSFCDDSGKTRVAQFLVDPLTRAVDYDRPVRGGPEIEDIREWYGDSARSHVFWNAKFDVRMIGGAGVSVTGTIHEGMFAAHVCDSDQPTFALKPYSARWADITTDDQDVLKKAVVKLRRAAKRRGWAIAESVEADYWLTQYADELDVPEASRLCEKYAATDAERTMVCWLGLVERMRDLGVREVYDAEMRLWPVIYSMEERGVRVSPRRTRECRVELERERDTARAVISKECGAGFNPASAPQKVAYFVEKLGLEPLAYTAKAHNPQVDSDFFEAHRESCPAAEAMIRWSECEKSLSTYVSAYETLAVDWVIHASYRQLGPLTGRLACAEPNLQNIPKRGSALTRLARRPLGPRPGHSWYAMDYMQIEARLFAEASQEEALLAAFEAGRDPYQELADTIQAASGVGVARQVAKGIFLGKMYGMGRKKMAAQLRMDLSEAREVFDAYEAAFPRSVEFMRECISAASRTGEVRTVYGRRIPVDRKLAYKAVNYKIQPEAADLIKHAMVRCDEYLQETGRAWLLMQIHDELVFEVEDGAPRWIVQGLVERMEDNEGMFKIATPVDVSRIRGSWLNPVKVRLT